MAVSPSMVSGRVVATMIFSSTPIAHISTRTPLNRNLPTRVLYWVCKRRNDTKLELLLGVVTWHAQKCPLLKLLLIDLDKAYPAKVTAQTSLKNKMPTSRFESVVLRRTHQFTRRFARYMIPSSCRRQKFSTTAFESCLETTELRAGKTRAQ